MAKIGADQKNPSTVLWLVGFAILLVAGFAILNNSGKNLPDDEDSKVSAIPQVKPHDRTQKQESLPRLHHPSSGESATVTANEEMISKIIGSGQPVDVIAEELLEILPTSKGAEQVQVASHLANLAEGEQLGKLVDHMSDPRLNSKSKEEIFTAIYQCEPKQAADLLIKVIEKDVQEFAEEAQTSLSILLQADHGMDAVAWREELNKQGESLDPELIQE